MLRVLAKRITTHDDDVCMIDDGRHSDGVLGIAFSSASLYLSVSLDE